MKSVTDSKTDQKNVALMQSLTGLKLAQNLDKWLHRQQLACVYQPLFQLPITICAYDHMYTCDTFGSASYVFYGLFARIKSLHKNLVHMALHRNRSFPSLHQLYSLVCWREAGARSIFDHLFA